MAQPVILIHDPIYNGNAPITSTEVIAKGDLVDITSSGYIYKMDAAGDNDTFVGVALDASASGETDNVTFSPKCIVEIDTTSADYLVGNGLKYTSANTLVDDGGADTIGWAWEHKSSATRLNVFIDAPALYKKFEVNA